MKAFDIDGSIALSLSLYTDVTNSNYDQGQMKILIKTHNKNQGLYKMAINTVLLSGEDYSRSFHRNRTHDIRELLELMQVGTLDPEVAFLNASLILDVFPVLAAAHKTLLAKSRESLTTRTIHSELVYNYSGSKHITESLKRCGISESSTYVLVACFNASNNIEGIEKLVKGKEIGLEELPGRANQAQIQKHYKITVPELGVSTLADAITCRIAVRDAL